MLLGFGVLDATYQTVTTITTVGFREVEPLDGAGQVFTIVLILAGVGTALYTLTVGLELIVEGHLGAVMERRRMDKRIDGLRNHVILCGWGRVGRAIAKELGDARRETVIVDNDPERVATVDRLPYVLGDATSDNVLRQAGIEHPGALVAALSTDAANLFITLSGRALRPDLFIVARARRGLQHREARPGRRRPGGQPAGDRRRPHGRVPAATARHRVPRRRDARPQHRAAASRRSRSRRLALRRAEPAAGQAPRSHRRVRPRAASTSTGASLTNPDPDTELIVGQILIAIGTDEQLRVLVEAAAAERADARSWRWRGPVSR